MITFTVPGLTPAKCSPNARCHPMERHRAGKAYEMVVGLIANTHAPSAPFQRARITITQRAVRLADSDNFAARCKPAIDAVVRAGIVVDDSPDHVELVLKAERVKKRIDEETFIEIEEVR